jgi:hypothetical protein
MTAKPTQALTDVPTYEDTVNDLCSSFAPIRCGLRHIRVGAAGHRTLGDVPVLRERVRESLTRIQCLAALHVPVLSPVRLTVISSLAEGADRIIASEVLELPDTHMEVVLPLKPGDYSHDFDTDASKHEFHELLERAGRNNVHLPLRPLGRPLAYAQAGRSVIERSDVLVALWDGQPGRGPGGTAWVIERARRQGLPLIWICTESPHKIVEENLEKISLGELDALNRHHETSSWSRDCRRFYAGNLMEQYARAKLLADGTLVDITAEEAKIDPDVIQREASELVPFLGWILPPFIRCDQLAMRFQWWTFRTSELIYLFAALAVVVAAANVLWFADAPQLAIAEAVLVGCIGAVYYLGHHFRIHRRWLSYRFLAEHYRAWLFRALVGAGYGDDSFFREHGSERWLKVAVDEVWRQRPNTPPPPANAEVLRIFLTNTWLEDQRSYHEIAQTRHQTRHMIWRWSSWVMFILVSVLVVAEALLGVLGRLDAGSVTSKTLAFAAISLPAMAASIRGLTIQRESERNAARSGQIARRLAELEGKVMVESSDAMSSLRRFAAKAAEIMLTENRDWFVIMEFHDVEQEV